MLQQGSLPTTNVQGGCFTPNHKWLCVCDVEGHERLHCHSTLNGVLMDHRQLLADTDESAWTTMSSKAYGTRR